MMAKDGSTGPVTLYKSGRAEVVNVDPQPEQIAIYDPTEMKVVILAGGKGTRLHDVSKGVIPKPMVRIGDVPFLEHIIGIYSAQGFRKFIVAAGYLGEVITDWLDANREKLKALADEITVVDTGVETQTGGRLLRLAEYIGDDPSFMMTYGDGFSDVNLAALLEFHSNILHQYIPLPSMPMVTLTAANPPARFGNLVINEGFAVSFGEKPQMPDAWINAGFYVIDAGILELIPGDDCRFEYDVLPILAVQRRLGAFQHPGFFQMCDTWRDLKKLQQMWSSGEPPWARWK